MKLKLDEQGNVVLQDGKPVYIHDDGKEVAFDAPSAVSKITALNAEARSHREAKEAAETKLKAFDGIEDGEAARKALETIKNIDEGKLIAAGKVEEIKAAAQKAAQEQVAAASKAHAEELARTKQALDNVTGDLYAEKIGGSFTRSKLISEKFAIPADLVQARFGSAFKVEDGKIVAYDQAGNKIFSRARPGDLADFDEALETLVDQYPYKEQILKGTGASGGGAGGGPGAGGNNQLKGNLGGTREERTAAIASRFPELSKG
ncbi:DUF6651 domain-containing protein [Cupriavidus nantongensis]|uniref:DUF6651 domain-containing protein n=1 Tax=Cupriavidus nantongensis TaxID=1796606 RepID=A0A142JHW1_9BURK|nr:DUF6651 domain-containing protein [Cupriavidus nantongensis]AMR77673.1 hypothetical protein A2G96_07960 [Cupriavidus nantongensis]